MPAPVPGMDRLMAHHYFRHGRSHKTRRLLRLSRPALPASGTSLAVIPINQVIRQVRFTENLSRTASTVAFIARFLPFGTATTPFHNSSGHRDMMHINNTPYHLLASHQARHKYTPMCLTCFQVGRYLLHLRWTVAKGPALLLNHL
jgi:hypothetical protein